MGEEATESQNAGLSMRRATPPATKRSGQLAMNKNVQRPMRQVMRNHVPQHMKRFVHRVVMATISGMPSTGMGSEKRDGTTATLLPESLLASGCRSSLARTSRCRSRSRSASLCRSKPAAKCQGSRANLCQRRAADRCRCRSQPRWPSRSALEVEVLTDPEAMEDTGAEKQFVAL